MVAALEGASGASKSGSGSSRTGKIHYAEYLRLASTTIMELAEVRGKQGQSASPLMPRAFLPRAR